MATIKLIDIDQQFYNLKCVGFEQLTISNVALGLTVPDKTMYAVFQLETNNIRMRFDGTNPTAAIGHLLTTTDNILQMAGREIILRTKVIRAGGADGILNVSYFGRDI